MTFEERLELFRQERTRVDDYCRDQLGGREPTGREWDRMEEELEKSEL